jgi:hypothetical protein
MPTIEARWQIWGPVRDRGAQGAEKLHGRQDGFSHVVLS